MNIGILATGITPDELLTEHGSYADMFMQLFRQLGRTYNYTVFDVRLNQFPESAQQCDAWIITGSASNVDENTVWMQRLKQLILEIDQAARPLIGICFGHQIIAEAFGGRVEAFKGGWGAGLHSYQMVDAPLEDCSAEQPERIKLSAMHRYQVVEKPEPARVFARSEFCEFAGLSYGDRIVTLQAHPEFSLAYESALLALRAGGVIPQACAEQAKASLAAPGALTDSLQVASWLAAVLER